MAHKRVPRAPPPAPEPHACDGSAGGCDIGELFRVLGRTHMLDILWTFVREAPRPRRFVEVQDELALSPNTLSARLKELVDVGLLSRVAYNEIPPRVDYAATARALDLKHVFDALQAWSNRHTLSPVEGDAEAPQTA